MQDLLSLEINIERDNLKSLFKFILGIEEYYTYVAPFKYSILSNNRECKLLIKDNSISRTRMDSKKGTTDHLIAVPRDGLNLSAIAASRREHFKNDCAEVNT